MILNSVARFYYPYSSSIGHSVLPNAYSVILASCLKESHLAIRRDCATLVLRAAFARVIVYLDAKLCNSALLRGNFCWFSPVRYHRDAKGGCWVLLVDCLIPRMQVVRYLRASHCAKMIEDGGWLVLEGNDCTCSHCPVPSRIWFD